MTKFRSDEPFTVVKQAKCEDVTDLLDVLFKGAEIDPRGEDVGQAVAVCIGNMCVGYKLVEFADGTRTVILEGV